ncbi:hypothetical protein SIN8267_02722 [Sinobacterium norvegicum]|uniref:Aminopeptidase n=1 Tax=Sinobacterium norvegicum TaxID=1641715 RepID=A0ABM9AHW6_9GAMM|nr:aminopeptidase [Sinobacterium norvegicum]CAH0992589.1 hypothetical protein SIN8267_02722 [Sinobacterium norvegicum]
MLRRLLAFKTVLIVLFGLLLAGCEGLGYYWQAGAGQLDLMQRQTPIDTVVEDGNIDSAVASKLTLVLAARDYAEQMLLLPVGDSYSEFVQLEGDYAVWNVYAAEPYSVVSYRWCYALVGCMGYRGYFDRQEAEQYAAKMAAEGYEVFVGGVAAYSTLGWFDDPVMSSFTRRSDLALVSLLFHELAHRKLYIKGDTAFNESYASAVAIIGLQQWQQQAMLSAQQIAQWQQHQQRSSAFHALLLNYRQQLSVLYQREDLDQLLMAQHKATIYEQLTRDYQQFRHQWQGYSGYDHWMASVNNAKLATVADYYIWVDSFLALYRQSGNDIAEFYRRVNVLSQRPKEDRALQLSELKQQYRRGDRVGG